jgi:predicted  nucleic acid-binding Zn-ribbon protein
MGDLGKPQQMTTPARLETALKRLAASLDQLEAAAERRAKAEAERSNLEEEFAVMQDDRTRLALELDGVLARSSSLELANDDVSRRLKNLGTTIKMILDKAYLIEK